MKLLLLRYKLILQPIYSALRYMTLYSVQNSGILRGLFLFLNIIEIKSKHVWECQPELNKRVCNNKDTIEWVPGYKGYKGK